MLRFGLGKGRGNKPAAVAQLHDETGCALTLTHTANGLVSDAFGDPTSIGDFQKSEIENRAFVDRVHLLDRVNFLQALDDACSGLRSQSIELRFRSKGNENGGWTWLMGHVAPLQSHSNAPTSARVRYENITQRKVLEAELTRMHDELDGKNAEHSQAMSQVGHQIGNSLQVIMGNAELLALNEANISQRVTNILDAAQELNFFADEVRQTTKSSWEIDVVKPDDFNWSTALSEVVETLHPTAKKHELVIETDVPTSLPNANIDLRSVKLLLSNSLKEVMALSPEKSCILVRSRQFGPKIKTEFFHDAEYINGVLLENNFIIKSALKKLEGEFAFKSSGSRHQLTLSLPIKSQSLRTASDRKDLARSKTVDKKGEYRARLSA